MRWERILGILIALPLAAIQEILVAANQEDEIRLGVTIRNREMLERAPSCMHTYSRVELVNQHNSEVVIKSIDVAQETTIRVDIDGTGEIDEIVFDTLSRQVHASKVSNNFLSLDPGQGAIVPLTFLPRFPPPTSEGETLVTMSDELNPWQQADREAWIGSVGVRSNLGLEVLEPEIYSVTTMLLVETNYGVAKVPFDANSVRDNPYSLPDVVYFDTSAAEELSKAPHLNQRDYLAENDIRIMDSAWNVNSKGTAEPEPDCYDLYLRHPRESFSSIDIQVQEVMVSRPESISVQIIPEKTLADNDLIPTEPRHVIRQWTEDGPLLIPPDDNQHYVATMCTATEGQIERDFEADQHVKEKAHWIDPPDADGSLGFVQIRTDSETLVISLMEFGESNVETRSVRHLSKVEYGILPHSATRNTTLEISPEQLVLVALNGTGDSVSMSLDLTNTDQTESVTVMRTSLAFEEDDAADMDRLGINMSVSPVAFDDRGWVLGPGESVSNAFSLDVSWDFLNDDAGASEEFDFYATGKILVQCSKTYKSAGPWIRAAMLDPTLDANFVAEVPVLFQLVVGDVGVTRFNATIQDDMFFLFNASLGHISEIGTVRGLVFPYHNHDLDGTQQKHGFSGSLATLENWLCVFTSVEDVKLSLQRVKIVDEKGDDAVGKGTSLCDRFEIKFGWWSEMNANYSEVGWDEARNIGMIQLEYDFARSSQSESNIFPTKCSLRFTTTPETGEHSLPLIIYPGRVDVSVDMGPKGATAVDFASRYLADHNRVNSVIGFPGLLDWFQKSKAGKALRSLLGSKRMESDEIMLSRYLQGLSKSGYDPDLSTLKPILLKVGAINPDEKEVFPLFVTNYNPVPLRLTIDVGEVEGLRLTMGRDPVDTNNNFISHAKRTSDRGDGDRWQASDEGPFAGHPLEGLRQFLMTDPKAKSLLSFGFRDAIDVSQKAIKEVPFLEGLFETQLIAEYHKSPTPTELSGGCGDRSTPQSFNKFMSNLRGRKHPGPVTVSPDSKSVRSLPLCSNETKASLIVLPAGGVARFDITLQSPMLSLLDSDISQFLSTGVVLASQNREIIPVLVSYETPRGKLDASPDLGDEAFRGGSPDRARNLRIPAGTFVNKSPSTGSSVRIPPKSESFGDTIVVTTMSPVNKSSEIGVSLYMTSSFNRPVELLEVSSCNPLFEVVLQNGSLSSDPVMGIKIGAVQNVVPCAAPMENGKPLVEFPSFFLCAINWILGQKGLRSQGCGYRLSFDKHVNSSDQHDKSSVDYGMASRSFSKALFISTWSMGGDAYTGEKRTSDGTVAPSLVDAVAKADHIWRTGHDSDLLHQSTSLRAIIRYNSTSVSEASGKDDSEPHLLSLGMGNLTVDSVLEMPTLLARQQEYESSTRKKAKLVSVDFPSTFVGDVSSRMVRVHNPTPATVKVRLAVAPPVEAFENYVGKDALKIPADVRNAFLTEHEVPYVQSGIKAQSSVDYASQQWWDGGGSFFLPDAWGGLVRSHYNVTVRAASGALVSLLSPGLLANVAFIAGCGVRCAIKDEVIKVDGPHDVRTTSFFGASAGERSVLMGRQRSNDQIKAPRFFNAAGSMLTGGKGPAPFSVPFSSLQQEVEIPPYGEAELGPILFRPPGRTSRMGCESKYSTSLPKHCYNTAFMSTVLLENSLTGLERVLLQGRAAWERVTIQDILTNENDSDSYSDIELRNGREALIFPGTADFRPYGSPTVVKQLLVKNDGDVTVQFDTPFLLDTTNINRLNARPNGKKQCSLGEFSVQPCTKSVVRLKPGENFTIFVRHEPRCTQISSFVALVLEYKRKTETRDGSVTNFYSPGKVNFRKKREVLLLGYKMDASQLSRCVPSGGHVVFRFLEVMEKLGLKREEDNIFEGYGMLAILAFALTYTCIILTIGASGLILVRKLLWRLTVSSAFGKRLLGGTKRSNTNLHLDSNWLATLRCLSRLDPSLQDLQTLGREQTRLVLLNQFRVHGVLPPLCLNTSGVFQRERNTAGRSIGSKSGVSSGGSERIRTLSDAIFKHGRHCFSPSVGLVSFGAGWKTALSRGIIDDFSLERFDVSSATQLLLRFRAENPYEDESDNFESESIVEEEESVVSESEEADAAADAVRPSNDDDPVEDMEEIDSESDATDDDFSNDGSSEKFDVSETKATSVGDSSSLASSLHDASTSSFHSENAAEFTKVTQKGKPAKKHPKARRASAEIGRKTNVTAGAASDSKNQPVKLLQPASTKILAQKPTKKAATGKPSKPNGRLSAKAAPFEPKPTQVYRVEHRATPSKKLSAKPKEFTPSRQPPAPLRPPPGLAPPPGFEGSSSVSPMQGITNQPDERGQTGEDAVLLNNQAMSPTNEPVSQPVDRTPSPIVGEDLALAAASSPPASALGNDPLVMGDPIDSLLGPSSPPRSSHSRQNSADNFDIMDFLDGILDEGAAPNARTDTVEPPPPPPTETPNSDVSSPSLLPIPSNPWAGGQAAENEARSRASAYGINFDEDTSDRGVSESSLGIDLPMLTPAAILGQQSDEDKDNLHSSFYTNLMK